MLTLSLHMGTDILVAIGMIANIFIAKEDVLHHPGGCSMSSGWMFCIIWVDVLHHWSRCSASSGWMFRIIRVDVPYHPGDFPYYLSHVPHHPGDIELQGLML